MEGNVLDERRLGYGETSNTGTAYWQDTIWQRIVQHSHAFCWLLALFIT